MRRGKRYRDGVEQIDRARTYPLGEAIEVLQHFPRPKFDETIELAFALAVDPKKSDQMVRGTVSLPHGSGKAVRVVVIAEGDAARQAEEAGADSVGYKDIVEKIQGGWLDFDVVIAVPEAMREVGRLGRILGPRGLMPTPKTGTVTKEVARAVKEVKAGKIEFKIDKSANLHLPIGKMSFTKEALVGNGLAVIQAVLRAKPSGSKGQYVRSSTLTSTMGPGLRLDPKEMAVVSAK